LSCELAFSEAKLRRIRRKRREKLEAARLAATQIQELVARQSRLYTEADNLEKQEEELVRRELQNIEELEADEAAASDKGPLFNLGPEEIEIPPNFDWSAFAPAETVAEGPGSS
jgi:hypothetical protein